MISIDPVAVHAGNLTHSILLVAHFKITYGASDAVRRLFIIISGHYMFGGHPFTPTNIAGIAMALIGALAYSILNAH